jgi:hypothetical protein
MASVGRARLQRRWHDGAAATAACTGEASVGEARENEASGEGEHGAARGVGATRPGRGPPERYPMTGAGVRSPRGGRGLSVVERRCVARAGEYAGASARLGRLRPWVEKGGARPSKAKNCFFFYIFKSKFS